MEQLRQELMPPFCEFYHLSPDQFWDIEFADRDAMLAYMMRAIAARNQPHG